MSPYPRSFPGEVFGSWDPSKSVPVTVDVTPRELVIHLSELRSLRVPLPDAHFTRGGFDRNSVVVQGQTVTHETVHVHMRDDELLPAVLEVAPESLQPEIKALQRSRRRRRRWLKAALAAAVAMFFVAIGGLYLSLPLIVDMAVSRIPTPIEEELGKQSLQSMVGGQPVIEDGPVYDAVARVWERVLSGVGESPYTFELTVVDSSMVNAVAAPGGYVVVFTGLLSEVESPEELAGILAHEAQHVLKQHGLRRVVRSAGVTVMATLLLGDAGAVAALFRDLGTQLLTLSYSRESEREADESAVKLLVRADIDPSKLPDFFERLASEREGSASLALLSSHPLDEERTGYLRELIAEEGQGGHRPIEVDWEEVQGALSDRADSGADRRGNAER